MHGRGREVDRPILHCRRAAPAADQRHGVAITRESHGEGRVRRLRTTEGAFVLQVLEDHVALEPVGRELELVPGIRGVRDLCAQSNQ